MLLKLFKYDFKSIGRLALPMSLTVLIASILGALSVRFICGQFDSSASALTDTVTVVCMMLLLGWVFMIIAYSIGIMIAVLRRYYTNFFTDEGYLTFTLPCKQSTHLMSKILSGLAWEAISGLVLTACVIIVILGIPNMNIGAYYNTFDYYLYDIVKTSLEDIDWLSMAYGALNSIVTSVSSLLMMYMAITIGAMIANKHKILASVGLYFAISWVLSLIETVVTLYTLSGWYSTLVVLALHLIAIAVFYLLNKEFLTKKLNLA